ncbi:hypothetical protein F4778DRAFT_728792 [Xylariomycetidae sp. FL2044]|nr:hypothetical protein F4778DRAFT_728792 [Xylariomycetidae sp. FL2044]
MKKKAIKRTVNPRATSKKKVSFDFESQGLAFSPIINPSPPSTIPFSHPKTLSLKQQQHLQHGGLLHCRCCYHGRRGLCLGWCHAREAFRRRQHQYSRSEHMTCGVRGARGGPQTIRSRPSTHRPDADLPGNRGSWVTGIRLTYRLQGAGRREGSYYQNGKDETPYGDGQRSIGVFTTSCSGVYTHTFGLPHVMSHDALRYERNDMGRRDDKIRCHRDCYPD